MYGCDILFGAETSASIRRELTKAMGDAAPCARCLLGARCPLLPDDIGPLLTPVETLQPLIA